jgi:hypothetical protein
MAMRALNRYVLATQFADVEALVANVQFSPQLLTLWCWAACFSMVVQGLTQCEAANQLLNRQDCCVGTGEGCEEARGVRGDANPARNEVASPSEISNGWTTHLGRPVAAEGPISEARLVQVLDAVPRQVVQVWWTNGSTKHVVLVVGHGSGQFLVFDPCAGVRLMPYSDIETSLEDGSWEHTWIL